MNLPSWAALGPTYQSFDQMAASSKGLIIRAKAAKYRGASLVWEGVTRSSRTSAQAVASEITGLYT